MIHDIANIFPRMSGEEFVALKADIKANGLLEPIWTYEGKIIDGRHRYYACTEVQVAPKYREYSGSDPIGFVVSLNLKRRHMNESQRAMVAASLANMVVGGKGANSANLQNCASVSQSAAAEMLQVSPRSVATAAKVERDAPGAISDAVKTGVMSLNLASQVVSLPQGEQEMVAEAHPDQIRAVARETIRAHVANNSGNNEWYTPEQYVNAAREAMGGINTDPASSALANKTVRADRFFDAETNGLRQKWSGNVWMNPPYAQPLIADFCSAVVQKHTDGEIDQACVLVNNGTETGWFQTLLERASAVCFVKTRIRFIDPEGKPSGSPLQGQAIVYLGEAPESFADSFCGFGKVLFAA